MSDDAQPQRTSQLITGILLAVASGNHDDASLLAAGASPGDMPATILHLARMVMELIGNPGKYAALGAHPSRVREALALEALRWAARETTP